MRYLVAGRLISRRGHGKTAFLDLRDLSEQLTASCRAVDPASTDEIIQQAHAADVVEGEAEAKKVQTTP